MSAYQTAHCSEAESVRPEYTVLIRTDYINSFWNKKLQQEPSFSRPFLYLSPPSRHPNGAKGRCFRVEFRKHAFLQTSHRYMCLHGNTWISHVRFNKTRLCNHGTFKKMPNTSTLRAPKKCLLYSKWFLPGGSQCPCWTAWQPPAHETV